MERRNPFFHYALAGLLSLGLSGCRLGMDVQGLQAYYKSISPTGTIEITDTPPTTVTPPVPTPTAPPGPGPSPVPPAPPTTPVTGAGTTMPQPVSVRIGERCTAETCLALRYVVYRDDDGEPVLSETQSAENLHRINRLWSDCDIGFEIEKYDVVSPREHRLRFRTASYPELTQIRKSFEDDRWLLVVTTGPWDRRGSIGNTGANAWTNLPGEGHHGVVLESKVSTFANIIAHELGHYLSLDHAGNIAELMYPYLADHSTRLSRSECKSATWAAREFWSKAIRNQRSSN